MIKGEKTANFLSANSDRNWDGTQISTSRGKKKGKGKFLKSSSLDGDGILDVRPHVSEDRPQKPHPLRSPMRSFFRHNTVSKSVKLDQASNADAASSFSISPDGSAWTLEDDAPKAETSTVDGTPFSQTSNQLYYKTRPTIAKNKETHGLGIENRTVPISASFHDSFLKGSPLRSEDDEGQNLLDLMPSIRRRANSLDNIPSPSCSPNSYRKQYSPTEISKPLFNRTVSLSQRSPFRKRVAFAEPETSLSGLKEQRPRSFKRHKNALEALFDAIERQDLEEVKRVLQMQDLKINDLNADNFSPLDVALLKGNIEISQLLLLCGAVENPAFKNADVKASHLENLIHQADKKVNDFTASIVNCTSDNKESERQLREWEWRLYMLRLMQNTLISTEIPTEAPVVSAAPLSDQSIIVLITPGKHRKQDIITKYKVEWSTDETFENIKGEKLVMDVRNLQYTISGLEKSKKWYIRVRVGNLKGFGPPVTPEPPYVVPSSWHELNSSKPNYVGCKERLADLLDDIHDYKIAAQEKSSSSSIAKTSPSPTAFSKESPKFGRKGSVFRTMSKYTNLVFHSAPKLLKRIKGRGIYFATMVYNEDDERVLVTMDENIPVVEVDDNYSKSFSQEFYWLAKTSCTWEDVQKMLNDSSQVHSSHAIQIRRKLLQAMMVLQNATGVQDLGFLYYKAFKDAHGSILLLTINDVKKSDCGSRLTTMKWVPVSKLQKKSNSLQDSIVPQRLIPSLQDQISYHRRSKTPISRGLYLGYLKLRTAVDSLSIVVPDNHPNMLPHVKVRDIPNVTKEDWLWIQSLGTNMEGLASSPSGAAFESKIKAAAKKLFSNLGIGDEYANRHRFYNKEVIELNENVLLVLILPPVDDMCTVPGQSDLFHALSGYNSIPVQTFEMINTNTYQPEIMRTYARLSSILEMESFICQQLVREALSPSESKQAKERQASVIGFQQAVDTQWHNARWVLDVIQVARDKNCNCGVMVGFLYDSEYVYKEPSVASPSSKRSKELYAVPPSPKRNLNEVSHAGKNGLALKNSSSCLIKVYGTQEIGVNNNEFVEILVSKDTTAKDIVLLASQGMLKYIGDPTHLLYESSTDHSSLLGLVVIAGSKERCLRDDLKLLSLQNPWEKGDIYLRLKKEAYKAVKLGKSTSV